MGLIYQALRSLEAEGKLKTGVDADGKLYVTAAE
jgi:hypothetical protein